MTRQRLGSVIVGIAAMGYLATAALHTSGYSSVVGAAAQAPERVRHLLPMLWLGIGSDLVVLGLIVAAVAFRPEGPARAVLAVAALCPFADAGLQIRLVGFIPPTGILIVLGIVTLIGAVVLPSTPRAAANL